MVLCGDIILHDLDSLLLFTFQNVRKIIYVILYPAVSFRCFRHWLPIQPGLDHTTVCVKAASAEQATAAPPDE